MTVPRFLAALTIVCSVGIVLTSAPSSATASGPALAAGSQVQPGASTVHVGSGGHAAPFGPSPVQWFNGHRPNFIGSTKPEVQGPAATTNWAGWIDTGTTFSVADGQWTVPSVQPSQAAEYSSEWVGIGGVSESDLVQTGTSEVTAGGATSYFAWYEMLPANSVTISGPVSPGDVILASIAENSPGVWTITIEDQTENWTYQHAFAYAASALSAEWIQEAPTINGSQSTLANFGSASFTSLGVSGADLSATSLTDVVMVNSAGTIVAYPTDLVAGSFSVLFGAPRPSVTSVTPASGTTAGGTQVTIEGNYLYGATAVTFGGVEASGYVNADGSVSVIAPPGSPGAVDVVVTTPGGASPQVLADEFTYVAPAPPPTPPHGYWLVGSDGGIFTFGSAQFYGSTGNLHLQRPVVGITPTGDRGGYWLVASDGGIFSFGDSSFFGSIPGIGLHPAGSGLPNSLNAPIVGMVPSPDGGGYFMVAADGGVFAFGDARFAGSCPGIGGCSGTAVAVMPDATGNGYWLVTNTGAVYTFGDASYFGAPGNVGSPVTSAVRTPDGNGYWIVVANGTVYNFGDARNFGSPGGTLGGLNYASTIFATADGNGYWVASTTGQIYPYGDAPNDGSMAGTRLNGSIIAGTGW